jgi:hypothetical protein
VIISKKDYEMKKLALVAVLLLSTTGCIGNLSSVHRVLEVSNGEGALIDIKQRAIMSSVVPIYDEHGRKIRTETRVCAEASPDALSAYAAELAAKADSGKIGTELAAAFQEGSSCVGMRTPTIQSLRDASYRLCESYLNNAISGAEYGCQLRRFQRNMIVLAAVEQLTSTIRAPSVTIKMQGQAEAAKSLSEITAEKQKIDSKIAELENGTAEEKEKNKDTLAAMKKKSQIMNDAIVNATGLIAGGSATTSVESLNVPQATPQYIASVSKDILEMVSKIIEQDDRGQLCFIYLSSLKEASAKPVNEHLEDICVAFLSNQTAGVKRHSTESASDTLTSAQIPDTTKKRQTNKAKEKK